MNQVAKVMEQFDADATVLSHNHFVAELLEGGAPEVAHYGFIVDEENRAVRTLSNGRAPGASGRILGPSRGRKM